MLSIAEADALVERHPGGPDQRQGRSVICAVDRHDPYPVLRRLLGERTYLCDIAQRPAKEHGLLFERSVHYISALPSL